MEILHLLPATLETLFSVYWLNACNFCTVDVNTTKRKTQDSCRNKGLFTVNVNVKYVKLKSSIFCCWINISIKDINKKWLLLSPGPNHTSLLLLHHLLPMLPVVPGNWLAGFNWQWHLAFTVIEICVQLNLKRHSEIWNAATTWSGDKLWNNLCTHAQRWAILGFHTDLLPFMFIFNIFC